MPGCGHCMRFDEDWPSVCKLMKEQGITPIKISSKDAPEVLSFPTLILTINGKDYAYEGDRSPSDIAKWLKTKMN
jgi:hypothetical protein